MWSYTPEALSHGGIELCSRLDCIHAVYTHCSWSWETAGVCSLESDGKEHCVIPVVLRWGFPSRTDAALTVTVYLRLSASYMDEQMDN